MTTEGQVDEEEKRKFIRWKKMRKGRVKIMRNWKDKTIIVNYTALYQHEHPVASSNPENRRNPFLR